MFKDEVLRMEDGFASEDSKEESILIPHSRSTSFSAIGPGFRVWRGRFHLSSRLLGLNP